MMHVTTTLCLGDHTESCSSTNVLMMYVCALPFLFSACAERRRWIVKCSRADHRFLHAFADPFLQHGHYELIMLGFNLYLLCIHAMLPVWVIRIDLLISLVTVPLSKSMELLLQFRPDVHNLRPEPSLSELTWLGVVYVLLSGSSGGLHSLCRLVWIIVPVDARARLRLYTWGSIQTVLLCVWQLAFWATSLVFCACLGVITIVTGCEDALVLAHVETLLNIRLLFFPDEGAEILAENGLNEPQVDDSSVYWPAALELDPKLEEMEDLPDIYLCSITRGIMRQPAMVATSGHTYERDAILTW